MNILLVKPCWPYPYSKGEYTYNRIWPPLCLMNCASILEKQGHQVKILDAHAQRILPKRIKTLLNGYDKVFVTSSTLDRWQCPNVDIAPFLQTVQGIKEEIEEVYVMGYHGTIEPEKILKLTKARAIIKREPESAVSEICANRDLFQIKGLTFEHAGKIFSNPDREPGNLRDLPLPAFHLLDFRRYFYEILGSNFALFEIGRGCKFRCSFCNKVMYPQGVRNKSVQQVLEEIAQAVEKYGIKSGYFIDLDFLTERDIAEEICDCLIGKNYQFQWTCQTRPDLLDERILRKMKAAGCKIVHLGIESGSQETLNSLGKKFALDRIREAVKLCHALKMKTLAFFIFGFSGEKRQDREETFKFMKELNCGFVSLHQVFPYKGSPIYRDDFIPEREVESFIRWAFIRYYLRPNVLLRTLSTNMFRVFNLFRGRIITLR